MIRYCAACAFEKQYGTTKNPRPIPDLEIHTCGQEICILCSGYTVINGTPMGPFAVMDGDICPVCNHTGRVPAGTTTSFKRTCHSVDMYNETSGSVYTLKQHLERCSLPIGHEGGCDYRLASEVNQVEIERAKECVKRANQ